MKALEFLMLLYKIFSIHHIENLHTVCRDENVTGKIHIRHGNSHTSWSVMETRSHTSWRILYVIMAQSHDNYHEKDHE